MAHKPEGDSVPVKTPETRPEVVEPMVPHAHRQEIAPRTPAPPDEPVVEPMIPHNRRTDME